MGVFSNFDIDKETIENMVKAGYEQAKEQNNIINKFIINNKTNSESLSQSESDIIHKIISDVENDSEINSKDNSDNESELSNDSIDDFASKNIIIYDKTKDDNDNNN